MRIVRIPKRKGDWRVVVVPDKDQAERLRGLLPRLAAAERRLAVRLGVEAVAHGFIAGRSPVTNAWRHVGYQVTIAMDLADWFDSVRREQIAAALARADEDRGLADAVCHEGRPAQGLPTSPTAANLAAVALDREICDRLRALSCGSSYTRYADDLSISLQTTDGDAVRRALASVREAVAQFGWRVQETKTAVQWARAGRRTVTGIAVGPDSIAVPRTMRRRLRAAMYQDAHSASCQGLREWCRLRLPIAARPSRWYGQGLVVSVMLGPVADPEPHKPVRPGSSGSKSRKYQLD